MKFAVRSTNTTEMYMVEARDQDSAIEAAQVIAGKPLAGAKAIDSELLNNHLENTKHDENNGDHLKGSWFYCLMCDELRERQRTVDIIASGYEWTCPGENCGHLNHEIEATETVICSNCGRKYKTNPPDHAIG